MDDRAVRPRRLDELAPPDRVAGRPGEPRQDPELGRRQVDRRAPPHDARASPGRAAGRRPRRARSRRRGGSARAGARRARRTRTASSGSRRRRRRSPDSRSGSASRAVRKITGAPTPCARSAWTTSRPSRVGQADVDDERVRIASPIRRRSSPAVAAAVTSNPSSRRPRADQRTELGVVLEQDHERLDHVPSIARLLRDPHSGHGNDRRRSAARQRAAAGPRRASWRGRRAAGRAGVRRGGSAATSAA